LAPLLPAGFRSTEALKVSSDFQYAKTFSSSLGKRGLDGTPVCSVSAAGVLLALG
jgi:hypothetical protein